MARDDTPGKPRRRRWLRWVILLLIVAVVFVLIARATGVTIPDRTILVLDLRQAVPERSEPALEDLFRPSPPDIVAVRRAMRAARGDERVLGLLLRVGMAPFSPARSEEIRELVAEFRESGKEVIAYADGADTAGFQVASAADEVWISESAPLFLTGVAASALFLKDALDRLGIEPQFVRVGAYKTAFEQLSLAQPTPEFRESMNELVGSLFTSIVAQVASSRSRDPELVRELVDQAPLEAENAVEARLADAVVLRAELRDRIRARFGDDAAVADIATYHASLGEPPATRRLALIEVDGMIVEGSSAEAGLLGGITGAETVIHALEEAAADPTVAGVLLRIQSPGGMASAAEKIWHQVRRTDEVKPVVASLGEVAASGGYYIASAARAVVAPATCITGSIGVLGGKIVIQRLLEENGVHVAHFARGRRAGFLDPTRPLTEGELAHLEEEMQEAYQLFLSRVIEGRGLSDEEAEAAAQGRIWSGEQALELDLIDEIGGLSTAVAKLIAVSSLPPGADPPLVLMPPPPGLLELIRGGRSPELVESSPIGRRPVGSAPVELAFRLAAELERTGLLTGRSALALLPVWIRIR